MTSPTHPPITTGVPDWVLVLAPSRRSTASKPDEKAGAHVAAPALSNRSRILGKPKIHLRDRQVAIATRARASGRRGTRRDGGRDRPGAPPSGAAPTRPCG